MERQAIAALALAGLMMLAGCSEPSSIYLDPEVNDVSSVDDGSYQFQVTVNTGFVETDDMFADVRVYGYTLEGEEVCVARYGTISKPETRTMVCEAFPSLLVTDTADRNATIESNRGPFKPDSTYDIDTTAILYHGSEDDTHQFEVYTGIDYPDDQFKHRSNQPTPTPATLQTLQCEQWRDQNGGRDFSAVGEAPWLDWEQQPPNTSQTYRFGVRNYTHLQEHNRTGRSSIDKDAYVHSMEEIPPELRQRVESTNTSNRSSGRLNRTTFYTIVSELADQQVNSTDNLSAAMAQVQGTVGRHDDTGMGCWMNPPQYYGDQGWHVKVFVHDGDITWVVTVRADQTYSGQAFENVTASGANDQTEQAVQYRGN